jgi:dTDP-glucose pyrophosphorylase
VKLREGLVSKVAEKEVISNNATVGIYLYSQGKFYVDACLSMISNAEKSKGEYYIAPTYNYLIASGKKISAYQINQASMHGLGTPSDLEKYLQLSNSK